MDIIHCQNVDIIRQYHKDKLRETARYQLANQSRRAKCRPHVNLAWALRLYARLRKNGLNQYAEPCPDSATA